MIITSLVLRISIFLVPRGNLSLDIAIEQIIQPANENCGQHNCADRDNPDESLYGPPQIKTKHYRAGV